MFELGVNVKNKHIKRVQKREEIERERERERERRVEKGVCRKKTTERAKNL